ncbi:MAG: class I SAM-dependent rRNA methyltransferase [Spirochaetales bacterium]|nr:class I SAM-dependent rRNA methyltransferase [Spirochaetales bacterium]
MTEIVIRSGKEKSLLRHHPWVFSGAIEESSVPAQAGVYRVNTAEGRFIAWGVYDSESHIQLRLLSWKEDVVPDEQWWRSAVRASIIRRRRFFEDKASQTTAFRIIHGEADMLPGIAADVYGRIVRIIISARVAWNMRQTVVDAVEEILHPQMIILNTDSAFCAIEHLHEVTEYYRQGEKFTPTEKLEDIRIRESGLYYSMTPGSGQKSGFYCDQRENRIRIESYVKDAEVLDGCSYTGGFTLHALRAGARHVHAVDSSSDAVHRLLSNVNLNVDLGTLDSDARNRVDAEKADIFEYLRTMPRNKYDVIILDPPKLAQTIKALENAKKAYKDLNRTAMEKIRDGGILVTCSCSGSLSREDFRTVLGWSAKDAGVEVQVLETLGQAQDHPVRLSFPESEYLKVYVLRVIKT